MAKGQNKLSSRVHVIIGIFSLSGHPVGWRLAGVHKIYTNVNIFLELLFLGLGNWCTALKKHLSYSFSQLQPSCTFPAEIALYYGRICIYASSWGHDPVTHQLHWLKQGNRHFPHPSFQSLPPRTSPAPWLGSKPFHPALMFFFSLQACP